MTNSGQNWGTQFTNFTCWAVGGALGTAVLQTFAFVNCAVAQITPDGTLPNNSSVKLEGNTRIIEGGTQAGGNLFHSFGEFSVPAGSIAHFNNLADIQNIISRVTGSSISNIDGAIGANGTANLFLINPNGIIFGSNASLDLGGSFLATSASSLKFADGKYFSAIAPQTTPLLTISVPSGLQFGGNAGRIQNQSVATNSSGKIIGLQVQPGRTLAFVGGEIMLNGGSLQAENGRVELAAVAGGTIGLSVNGDNLGLSVPQDVDRANVSFTNAASIDVTGRGQGGVGISARNLNILGGKISAGVGHSLTADSSPRGNITLNATETVSINYPSRVTNVVASDATGSAGDIVINAGQIKIDNRATPPKLETDQFLQAALDTGIVGTGRAGNISLSATGSIELFGQDINSEDKVISTFSFGKQQLGGGDITLQANGSILLNNAYLNAVGGYGGNVSVIGNESVSITENSFLNAGTGSGDSKNITVQSNGPVTIQRSRLGNNVGGDQLGNAGNIIISGRSVSLIKGSLVEANAEKDGVSSGNIQIHATDRVEISGNDPFHGTKSDRSGGSENTILTTSAKEGAWGKAGDITLTAGEIYIDNRASASNNQKPFPPALDSSNSGHGSGGNVLLEANGSISLIGQSIDRFDKVIASRTDANALDAGNISLKANGSIYIENAYLDAISRSRQGANAGNILLLGNQSVSLVKNSALVAATYYEKGNAGNIILQSSGPIYLQASMLSANVGTDSKSSSPESKAGNIKILGRSVNITDGAVVTSRAFRGNSSNIEINGQEFVELSGVGESQPPEGYRPQNLIYSQLTTSGEERASGASGNISITTGTLRLSDGANIRADSKSPFKGGNITVNAKVVELTGGGQFITTASSSGDAGNITLNVTDRITINGSNSRYDEFNEVIKYVAGTEFIPGPIDRASGIFANTSGDSTSQGGNVQMTTERLVVSNGAVVSVSARDGLAGNLEVTARSIRLENQGQLVAVTGAGEKGANITLQDFDLLLMRDRSLISAAALNNANGGNITINAKDGFIVAVSREDSDIVANAFQGNGGQINITTSGIYGLENRSQQSRDSKISEINASSDFGFDGTIEVNTPDIDPDSSLVNLPDVPVDTEVAQSCTAGGSLAKSQFIITGRGGLPPNPGEALSPDAVRVDLVTLNPSNDNRDSPTVSKNPKTPVSEQIIEATGWVINEKGEVVLTANLPANTPYSPWFNPASCRAS